MISTCRSEAAATILARSTLIGRPPDCRWMVIRVVPVVRSSMRGSTPMCAEMSIAGRNKSTAWPPVLRNVGARSTTVTSKPRLASQYATTGPAMLAPEIKTRTGEPPYLTIGKLTMPAYQPLSQLNFPGEPTPLRYPRAHPRCGPRAVPAAGCATDQPAGHRRQIGDYQTRAVLPLRLARRADPQHRATPDRRRRTVHRRNGKPGQRRGARAARRLFRFPPPASARSRGGAGGIRHTRGPRPGRKGTGVAGTARQAGVRAETDAGASHPRGDRVRRPAGLLPAVSRRAVREAACRGGRGRAGGSGPLTYSRQLCALDCSFRRAGDWTWWGSNPPGTGR